MYLVGAEVLADREMRGQRQRQGRLARRARGQQQGRLVQHQQAVHDPRAGLDVLRRQGVPER